MNNVQIIQNTVKGLKARDIPVKKVKGWKTRGRPGSFNPRGVMPHHTASNRHAGNMPSLGIVTNGRSDLPGPLSHFLLARDGTVVVVAAGRCNHAGLGGPHRGIPKDSANAYMWGIEAENNGLGEPWSKAQIRSYEVLCGLLLRHTGRGARMCFAHKEWTPRKIDPTGITMASFRARVRKRLRNWRKRWS